MHLTTSDPIHSSQLLHRWPGRRGHDTLVKDLLKLVSLALQTFLIRNSGVMSASQDASNLFESVQGTVRQSPKVRKCPE